MVWLSIGERLWISPRFHRRHHSIGIGHETVQTPKVVKLGPPLMPERLSWAGTTLVLLPWWDMLMGTANFELRYDPTGIRDQVEADAWPRTRLRKRLLVPTMARHLSIVGTSAVDRCPPDPHVMFAPWVLLFDSLLASRGMLFAAARHAAVYPVPLLLMALLALVLQHFYWDSAVQGNGFIAGRFHLAGKHAVVVGVLGCCQCDGLAAPLMVVLLASPVLVVVSLLAVAFLMTPALVNMVAVRRFPSRAKAGRALCGISWSLASTVMALLRIVVFCAFVAGSPLVLVLPPLIWGWLTYG